MRWVKKKFASDYYVFAKVDSFVQERRRTLVVLTDVDCLDKDKKSIGALLQRKRKHKTEIKNWSELRTGKHIWIRVKFIDDELCAVGLAITRMDHILTPTEGWVV